MSTAKKELKNAIFQNNEHFFKNFRGQIIASEDIKMHNFSKQRVAIIGANQHTVTHLNQFIEIAESVKVFQLHAHFVLPNHAVGVQKILHPLLMKNRHLLNQRIKSTLALRYLDSQVKNTWLKRQLTPNTADQHQIFLKSDHYYAALQHEKCKLITWPVVQITDQGVQSMEGIEHLVDVIITTFEQ